MSNELTVTAGLVPVPVVVGRRDRGAQPTVPKLPGSDSTGNTDLTGHAAQPAAPALTNNGFDFRVDKQTGMTVVKVFNKTTGELVRQIPLAEVVHVAQLLRQAERHSVLDLLA